MTLSLSHSAAAAALVLASCSSGRPAKLTVAAAADLNFALEEIAGQFRVAHTSVELAIAYGSSGNFYSQIRNGAPFDILLSADIDYARRLAAAPSDVFTYAVGRIVVWVPTGSSLDPATALSAPTLRRLAIANPDHAPYGRAAQSALRAMGLYDTLQPKLVLGENIAQTFQFVQSGAADAGIIALSLALAPKVRGQGRYWGIGQDLYPILEQGGLIVKDSPAARDFRAYMLSDAGRRVLDRYGFSLPRPTPIVEPPPLLPAPVKKAGNVQWRRFGPPSLLPMPREKAY